MEFYQGTSWVSPKKQGKPKVPPETPTPGATGKWQQNRDMEVLVPMKEEPLQMMQVAQSLQEVLWQDDAKQREQNPENDAKQKKRNTKNDGKQKKQNRKNDAKEKKQKLENDAKQGEQNLEDDGKQGSEKQVKRTKRTHNKDRGKDRKNGQNTRLNQEQAANEDSSGYQQLFGSFSSSLSSSTTTSSSSFASSNGPKAVVTLANFPSLETLQKTAWSFFFHPELKPVDTPPTTQWDSNSIPRLNSITGDCCLCHSG